MCLSVVSLCLVTIQMLSKSVGAIPDYYGEVVYNSDDNYMMMPDACSEMNYCFEKGDNYPEDKIAKLLENMPKVLEGMGPRLAVYTDEDNDVNCPVNTTYKDKPIYYVKDKEGNVRVVVQSPNKFLQTYSVKTCIRPGRITNETLDLHNTSFVTGPLLEKFNISCVDTEMEFDFFVLNDATISEDDYTMEIVRTPIHICCRCTYTEVK